MTLFFGFVGPGRVRAGCTSITGVRDGDKGCNLSRPLMGLWFSNQHWPNHVEALEMITHYQLSCGCGLISMGFMLWLISMDFNNLFELLPSSSILTTFLFHFMFSDFFLRFLY